MIKHYTQVIKFIKFKTNEAKMENVEQDYVYVCKIKNRCCGCVA